MPFDATDIECTTTVRLLAVDMVQKANSGHPGMPLGAADMAHVIWSRYLRVNPADVQWFNRDRFVLSAGHGSALIYSLLHLSGFPLTIEDLKTFRQLGSKCPGHPEHDPELGLGIETTTGPLGQGISNAVGLALAERILAEKLNRPGFDVVDHMTYVISGDGDLMEGVSHEVASLAGHLGLDRLVVLYDDNGISIDGSTELTLSDDALGRFASYGWDVQRCDGHNLDAINECIARARTVANKPHLIACKTNIGHKSPLSGSSKSHGAPLGADNIAKTRVAFGRAADEAPFTVPEVVRARFAEAVAARGAAAEAQWKEMFARYAAAYPELAKLHDEIAANKLPENWRELVPSFPAGTAPMATRVASGKVLEAIFPGMPTLIGGSADLTPSNNTRASSCVDVQRGKLGGNYIHYGVREHGMGSIMNGLALHNLRPYGATFLVFCDYMRPPIRMAALMKLPSVFVFTHDSIGLGEDGPTHQPVEHLTIMRAIPNLHVVRPADANETAAAWRLALERTDGPTLMALSRQDLPIVSPPGAAGVAKGAYVVGDEQFAAPHVVVMATGSEVSIAVEAQKALAAEGVNARVVSVPCMEVFDSQPQEYRDAVLPAGVPRIGVEAGLTAAWYRYRVDRAVGIDTFGTSAPAKVLFQHFNITSKAIVAAAKDLVAKH
eukprot:m51a1_g5693 putative transketolase (666) ;mRNA; f:1004742-1006886